MISAIDYNLDLLKTKKIETKDLKNLIYFSFDLDYSGLPKFNEKSYKIYTAKTLNNSTDYIILGTNKGLIVLKFNSVYKPDIIASNKLIEFNNYEKLFAYMSAGGNNIYELALTIPFKSSSSGLKEKNAFAPKFSLLVSQIFDGRMDTLSKKIKASFSPDGTFMSVVNFFNQTYIIYALELSEELKFVPTAIKSGKGIDVVWSSCDDYFAVVCNSENSSIKVLPNNVNNITELKRALKSYFSLSVYKIEQNSENDSKKLYDVQTVYSLNE